MPAPRNSSRDVEVANLRVQIAHLEPAVTQARKLRDQNSSMTDKIARLERQIKLKAAPGRLIRGLTGNP